MSETKPKPRVDLETITKFATRKGFVYPGSPIYGGLANTWDYGNKGTLLKNNIKNLWRRKFIFTRTDMYEQDAGILMNQKVWEASGHVGHFSDSMLDCKSCKSRFRADHLVEAKLEVDVEGWAFEKIDELVKEKKMKCPKCGNSDWTPVRFMSGMFETNRDRTNTSVNLLEELLAKKETEDDGNVEIDLEGEEIKELENKLQMQKENRIYLRPETAQAIFVQFKNTVQAERARIPFGIAQIGKAFRNEITPGNFMFRLIELEQMEIEYFIHESQAMQVFEDFLAAEKDFLTNVMGFAIENLYFKEIADEKRAHYSKRSLDIQYLYPQGFDELWGLAYRTNYDLTQHQEHSGENLEYTDPVTNEKYVAHVVEPSVGVDRLFLATLCEFYREEAVVASSESEGVKEGKSEEEMRIVMAFPYELAPYKLAVLPLMKKDGLAEYAETLYKELRTQGVLCDYDESGSIGKRYRREDENGTPWCLCVDYQTLQDNTFTLRHRDTMQQLRVSKEDLAKYLSKDGFGK
jgi:glycyl-tRNA synthetase